jgi:hypothetical protein
MRPPIGMIRTPAIGRQVSTATNATVKHSQIADGPIPRPALKMD